MAIASPIVPNPSQVVAAARAALTEALVLKVGQVLQAVVVGKTADGLTALKIGDQVVTAKLPQLSLPTGSTLQLQVKVAGSTPQLQILDPSAATTVQIAAKSAPPLPPAPQRAAETVVVAERPAPPTQTQAPAPAEAVKAEPPQASARPSFETESTPSQTSAALRPAPIAVETSAGRTAEPTPVTTRLPHGGPPKTESPTPAPINVPLSATIKGAPVDTQLPVEAATNPVSVTTRLEPNPAPSSASSSTGPPAADADAKVQAPAAASVAIRPTLTTIPEVSARPAQSPSTVATTISAGGEASEPAEQHSLLVVQSAPRPAASVADLPRPTATMPATPAQGPVQASVAQPPPAPTTPQAALAQMLPEALSRQNSVGPLLTSLAAAVEKPGLLPEPILRVALGLLAQRILAKDGKVSASQIEQAVDRSGVTLEASLLRGEPQPRDAKAGLLALRETLAKWLGGPPAPPVNGRETVPPPIKGLPLRAPQGDAPPPLPDAPREVGRLLHNEADAAVSRIKLMQMASLPDGDPAKPASPTLRMELPFLIGHELVMAQIQIGRDGARREAERKRGWTMRFALNFSATGEVGAEVGVLAKAVNVSLWAAEPETASAMAEALPDLTRALEAAGLAPGAVRIRQGVPARPPRPPSGKLLDSTS